MVIAKYENGELIIDMNLLPEGYDLTVHINGRGTDGSAAPGIELTFKSNLTYTRHGTWAEKIDKRLKSLPGARLEKG